MVEPEHDLGRNIEEQDENLLQVADQNSNLLQVEEDQDGDQFLDQEEQDDEQVKLHSASEFIPVQGVPKYTQSQVSHPKSGCPKIYLGSGNTGSPKISITVQGSKIYPGVWDFSENIRNSKYLKHLIKATN